MVARAIKRGSTRLGADCAQRIRIGTYPSGLTTGGRRLSSGRKVNATLTGSLCGIWS